MKVVKCEKLTRTFVDHYIVMGKTRTRHGAWINWKRKWKLLEQDFKLLWFLPVTTLTWASVKATTIINFFFSSLQKEWKVVKWTFLQLSTFSHLPNTKRRYIFFPFTSLLKITLLKVPFSFLQFPISIQKKFLSYGKKVKVLRKMSRPNQRNLYVVFVRLIIRSVIILCKEAIFREKWTQRNEWTFYASIASIKTCIFRLPLIWKCHVFTFFVQKFKLGIVVIFWNSLNKNPVSYLEQTSVCGKVWGRIHMLFQRWEEITVYLAPL